MRIGPKACAGGAVAAAWVADCGQWDRPGLLLCAFAAALCLAIASAGKGRALSALLAVFCAVAASSAWDRSLRLDAEQTRSEELDDRRVDSLVGTIEGLIDVRPDSVDFALRVDATRIGVRLRRASGGEQMPRPGDRIRVDARLFRLRGPAVLGGRNARRDAEARGLHLLARGRLSELQVLRDGEGLWRWAQGQRARCVAATVQAPGPARGRALVRALSCGDRSAMDASSSSALRAAGLAHLLAISGMHLGALAMLAFGIGGWSWSRTRWRGRWEPRQVGAVAAVILTGGFGMVVGLRPSTLRALALVAIYCAAILLDRRVRFLDALAWVLVLILLWRPALLWDSGCQLSFAASALLGLALGHRRDVRLDLSGLGRAPGRWRQFLAWLGLAARSSFWATVATAPIAAAHFGQWSWLGVVSNVVAVPLTLVLLLPLSLLGVCLAPLSASLGALLLAPAATIAEIILVGAELLEQAWPMSHRSAFGAWAWAAWIGLVVLALVPRRALLRRAGVVALAGWLVLPWDLAAGRVLSDAVVITFVDVGQGDAAVVDLPGGEVWLIDGGGLPFAPDGDDELGERPGTRALLPTLRARGIDEIDLAVVSHPHPDHFLGMRAVARALRIRELWTPVGSRVQGSAYDQWLRQLEARGTTVRAPPLGPARETPVARLRVLWPQYEGAKASVDPVLGVNDNSLVLRLEAYGRTVLFTGDIEGEAEEALVHRERHWLDVDVVKVPHHGSRTSSSARFAAATTPLIAVISCGLANAFGFPAPVVLQRWHGEGAELLRTDLGGSVELRLLPGGDMRARTRLGSRRH